MLTTSKLTYRYAGQADMAFPDIACQRGEHWLLLGQSGSGKTTLLHLLGGLLSPKSGAVMVGGTDLASLSGGARDRFRGQRVGIIFQQSHFVRALTVEENLLLAQQLAGLAPDRKRARNLLDQLNVGHKTHSKPDQLSVGEQQRVAIARAVINQPAVILADEPTSALDDSNCDEVLQLLQTEANAVEAALLIVTHDGRLKNKFSNSIQL